MPFPHLPRAPIVEGVVQFHVKPSSKANLERLAEYKTALKETYPVQKDIRLMHAEIQMKGTEVAQRVISSNVLGYRLERTQPAFVVIARLDSLAVSKLAPYETWEKLIEEARPLWKKYLELQAPEAITRVATRYINRIELPIENLDFEHYLAISPRLPKGIPEVLSNFLVKTIVEDEDSGASISISQVLEAPIAEKNRVPVLIDIDVYKTVDFSPDSDEYWQLLDKMRDLKNRAFFGCLTEKALEGFK
jgi:uncharacterized protein (TIGR04255 family)